MLWWTKPYARPPTKADQRATCNREKIPGGLAWRDFFQRSFSSDFGGVRGVKSPRPPVMLNALDALSTAFVKRVDQ